MCSGLCRWSYLFVDQMLIIWTVARIIFIRKRYFKKHLKEMLITEAKDSCHFVLTFHKTTFSACPKKICWIYVQCSLPIWVYLQFMQRKSISYSVSITDKDYSKFIQWNHQIKLYFLYYDLKHALEFWKELCGELFGEECCGFFFVFSFFFYFF